MCLSQCFGLLTSFALLWWWQCQEESQQQVREFEEAKKQIEEDSDHEIQSIRLKYERMLRDEKEMSLCLKGETGIMRKKVRWFYNSFLE